MQTDLLQMDSIDWAILGVLQADASLAVQDVGDRVGLSSNACWRRIKRLEDSGIIARRVALVDPARLGLGLTTFVAIEAPDHSADWRERFLAETAAMPEIMEIHRMAGEMDYLLRVAVADMAGFDRLYRRLTDAVPIKNVTSHFAMERIRYTTAYPIDTTSR